MNAAPKPKLLRDIDARGVAILTLNRPDASNAYDQDLIDALDADYERLGGDDGVRAIVLRGAGRHFSGGADVRWHERPRDPKPATPPVSVFDLCDRIAACPHPTLALVQGGCIGGALALAASCDIVIAADDAFFSIPEVRLGFAPGPRSAPLFSRAIGVRNFRRYGMTGQRFGAEDALRMGLAHQVCPAGELAEALARQLGELLAAAPGAARKAKMIGARLVPADPPLTDLEALFGGALAGAESIEGHRSFLEKRRPNWYPETPR